MADEKETEAKSLADKLNYLFATVHPRGRGEYTHEEVAEEISRRGVTSVSHTYIWQLRSGIKSNPTMAIIEALSDFFGVPPAYFFDQEAAARIDTELELLEAMRDTDVRRLAIRASNLSSESLRTIIEMVDRVGELEGKPGKADERDTSRRRRRRVSADEPESTA